MGEGGVWRDWGRGRSRERVGSDHAAEWEDRALCRPTAIPAHHMHPTPLDALQQLTRRGSPQPK